MFISFVLAFIGAVFGFYQLAGLPSLWVGVLLSVLLIISASLVVWLSRNAALEQKTHFSLLQYHPFSQLKFKLANAYFGFIIGACWVFWQTFFAVFIAEDWLNKPVLIQGTVSHLNIEVSSPERVRLRFRFKVDSIQALNADKRHQNPAHLPSEGLSSEPTILPLLDPLLRHQQWTLAKPTVQLSWYLNQAQYQQLIHQPKSGQRWQWVVKLKANHSAMNVGALDYETWLFQNRMDVRGYVRDKPEHQDRIQLLETADGLDLRHWLAQRLNTVFESSSLKGLYQALTYGEKTQITDAQWQVLQNTGTIHLMAISGLHMAIVGALGYWLFKGIWWLGLYRFQTLTMPMVGAIGAWLFASLYLVLSGYAIPTQRAYLMVMAVLLFLFLKRTFQPWPALALAALLVVLWDSRAVLSLGFWLSFLAVGLIFAMLQQPVVKRSSKWAKLVWIQLILTLGLAPYLIWAFHTLPSYSFISNLFAVPFVSLVGLPLLFFVSLLTMISVELAQSVMPVVNSVWQWFWMALAWVAQLNFASLTLGSLGGWSLIAIYIGLFSALLSQSKRLIGFSVLFVLLVVGLDYLNKPALQKKQAFVNLLDVGQGQALVIQTQNRVLVYDTGAKWGDKMDGAKLAILPFLRAHKDSQIDYLMVSHSDIDHAGGLKRLLENIAVNKITSGQPAVLNQQLAAANINPFIQACKAGDSWIWDGVLFEVFSPGLPTFDHQFTSDNDRSCVLKVTAGQQSVLIPGDLSAKAEQALIRAYGFKLQSTILIAGHHGSRYSSSQAWLKTVKPDVVLFTAGYQNRYGFPNADTLARLPQSVAWFNTACSGGIGYVLGVESFNGKPSYEARKSQQKWYHHRCLESEKGIAYQ